MSVRSLLIVALLAACGRLDFEATTRGDARFGDAPTDARVFGPWSAPQPLPFNLFGTYDDDPSITADGLELFFNSGAPRTGFLAAGDFFVATRTLPTEPFSTEPVLVAGVSTLEDETCPEISADGLTLYFGGDRGGGTVRDLYVTTRATRTGPWSAESRLSVSGAAQEASAVVVQDGLALYFDSDATGSGDFYLATRTTTADTWSLEQLLTELSDPVAIDGEHWVSENGLLVVFGSTRTGGQAMAIWQAQRSSTSEPFGTPTLVDELDSAGVDTDPFVTPDLRTIYFASDRAGGDLDLYVATRSEL